MLKAQVFINAPVDKVWEFWNEPKHIAEWNKPTEGWHTTRAENDLRTGGSFIFVMAAKDGGDSFNFRGIYTEVITHKKLNYTLSNGRTSIITFNGTGTGTTIIEDFEPVTHVPENEQQLFCEGVLETFKCYVEGLV